MHFVIGNGVVVAVAIEIEIEIDIYADLLRAEVVIEEIDPPPPFRSASSTFSFIAAASTIACSSTIFLVSVPASIVRIPTMSTSDQIMYDSKLSVDGLKKETTSVL
jgi:hypothetical protein